MASKRTKIKEPERAEHRLEIVSLSPVHATCACGNGWRYKADMTLGSVVDAVLHVDRWFQSHRRIERRSAA